MGTVQSTNSSTIQSSSSDIELEDISDRLKEVGVSDTSLLPPARSVEDTQVLQAMQRQQSSSARSKLFPNNPAQEVTEQSFSKQIQTASVTAVGNDHDQATKIEPIRMKSKADAENMGVPKGGVDPLVIRIAEQREERRVAATAAATATGETPLKPTPPANSLEVTKQNGKYFATSSEGGDPLPADGRYVFVTLLDGTTYLGRPGTGGNNAHGMLSGRSLFVAYAGEVEFGNGELKWFSNESGTYLPPEELHPQSGFESDKFRPVGKSES